MNASHALDDLAASLHPPLRAVAIALAAALALATALTRPVPATTAATTAEERSEAAAEFAEAERDGRIIQCHAAQTASGCAR